MKLLLAPHNDDETLFAAFTLLRERPLVVIVTDSYVQWNRGDGITADQRWHETKAALDILGCPGFRLGLRDDKLTEEQVIKALADFTGVEHVYAPMLQHGHAHHDMVCKAARKIFPTSLTEYCTYAGGNKKFYANEGGRAIIGTPGEWMLKSAALSVYKSQHDRSAGHFFGVKGQPEWLT